MCEFCSNEILSQLNQLYITRESLLEVSCHKSAKEAYIFGAHLDTIWRPALWMLLEVSTLWFKFPVGSQAILLNDFHLVNIRFSSESKLIRTCEQVRWSLLLYSFMIWSL
jgi:hypothetical protein